MLFAAVAVRSGRYGEVRGEDHIPRHRPAWAPGVPITEQPPREHGKYLLAMYAKGVMKSAGPFMDDAGGAVVIEVAGAPEAMAFAEGDPAVQEGVFVYRWSRLAGARALVVAHVSARTS